MLVLCHAELLATGPTYKFRDHTLLPVCCCCCCCWLRLFAATLHICRLSPSENWGLTMQGDRGPMWHGSAVSVRRVGVRKLYVPCHLGDEIFVCWLLIFVVPWCRISLMSPFWHKEFLRWLYKIIVWNIFGPLSKTKCICATELQTVYM
jgi:hypothetical protein